MPEPIVPPPTTPARRTAQPRGSWPPSWGGRAACRSAWNRCRSARDWGPVRSAKERARSLAIASSNGRSAAQPIASAAAGAASAPRARTWIAATALTNAARSNSGTARSRTRGGAPPLASARARAVAAARMSVAISSTMPSDSASSAATWRPLAMMSSAAITPTSRGSRCVPPAPGISPIRVSGSPTRPSGARMRAWQAIASSNPPPSAVPWIAATTGRGQSSSACRISPRPGGTGG